MAITDERLEELIGMYGESSCEQSADGDVLSALRELKALREQNRWIPVTEKLPEITQRWNDGPHNYQSSERVLAFAEGKVQVAEFFGSGGWGEDSGSKLEVPKFWRPLPVPPLEG